VRERKLDLTRKISLENPKDKPDMYMKVTVIKV